MDEGCSYLTVIVHLTALCARNIDGPGCFSALLPVQGVEYSQVCGKIIGYKDKTTGAFGGSVRDIDTTYVDGISLMNPRNHIWTFCCHFTSTTVT